MQYLKDDGWEKQPTMRVGDVIRFGGAPHRVILVNNSRARIVPMKKSRQRFKDFTGKVKEFMASAKAMDICPTADVEILSRARSGSKRRLTPLK